MQIFINGEARCFDDAPTLADVLAAAGLAGRRVAVEVNREIVPRGRHESHRLGEGDVVEIVQALGGG
jgi:sulfur carrier protein